MKLVSFGIDADMNSQPKEVPTMKSYITPDGAVFTGSSPEEIVRSMRDRGFYPSASPSMDTYMHDVVERLAVFNNETISTDLDAEDFDQFISILINHDYFREVPTIIRTIN